MRKTFAVRSLVENANTMLKTSVVSKDFREGVISLLETSLHETGNYRGYRYLDGTEVPPREKPGVIMGENGLDNIFPDTTRRRYF